MPCNQQQTPEQHLQYQQVKSQSQYARSSQAIETLQLPAYEFKLSAKHIDLSIQ